MQENIQIPDLHYFSIEKLSSYLEYPTFKYFNNIPGKEHFRLLAFLSTLFENKKIIDVQTNHGHSALALSFNDNNEVISFLGNEKKPEYIETRENIQFENENLLNESVQENWKDVIRDSECIFLDIEPHEGIEEIKFYQYLKNINYKGILICDDIWYFKNMRDRFWSQIPDNMRYDLTNYGHWSGTGIVSFDSKFVFDKYDTSNWTLVTAYFNLTKCKDASKEIIERDPKYYFSHSNACLTTPNNLIIYCDEESLPLIKKIRPEYLHDRTKYIIWDFDKIQFKKKDNHLEDNFAAYRDKINKNRIEKPYHFDNRNTASYYLFCMSRYAMLKDAIESNPFKNSHFCWINFCIERMGFKNLIHLQEGLALNRDKFSTVYIDYIPQSLVQNTHEYYRWGRCSMCSGFFTGNSEYMYKVCDLIENKFLQYLEQGYGHADEQLYSPVYFENPDLFEQFYGDYNEMIANYKYIYDCPEKPIYNFIRNSFQHGNYKKCLESCNFLWNSLKNKTCELNEEYINKLTYYTNTCKAKLNK